MATHTSEGPSVSLTPLQWLIAFIAALGFAFDTYELLMLPLIIRDAITKLGGFAFGSPEYNYWRDLFFYAPAVSGGIFGLLGGYLTDRLGRRRVLTWSILVYAFSAAAAGFATERLQLEPAPLSRLADPTNPDRPPRPPDDPIAAWYMARPNGMKGAHWPNRHIDWIEAPGWEESLPWEPTGKIKLDAEKSFELALVRGKKQHDKRDAIRDREQKREIDRALSDRRRRQ